MGGNFPGGTFPGGIFPGGIFPSTQYRISYKCLFGNLVGILAFSNKLWKIVHSTCRSKDVALGINS